MGFRNGERVRIKNPMSEYTGSRGTIVEDAGDQPQGLLPLGHFVAIDGENGRTRPFLVGDLERLQVARVRSTATVRQPTAQKALQAVQAGGPVATGPRDSEGR